MIPHLAFAAAVTPPLVYGATKLQEKVIDYQKRKWPDSPWTQSKRLKLSTPVISAANRMAFRRRFRRRRRRFRFRKRAFRRRFRRGFNKKVKRVIFRTLEAKKRDNIAIQEAPLVEGDGTSRVTYIANPAAVLSAGTGGNTITGTKFWLRGFSLRGSFHMDTTTPAATSCMVRVSLVFSRQQGLYGAGFDQMNSTTTLQTNPTQAGQFVNPQLFESTDNTAFVGDAYAIPFSRYNCKVLRSYSIPVNPSGDVEGTEFSMPTPFNLWFPINRMMQFDSPTEVLEANTPFKYGTYYIVIQVVASAAGTQTDEVVRANWRLSTFFRDI